MNLNDMLSDIGVSPTTGTSTSTSAVRPGDTALPLYDFQREAVEHALRSNTDQYGYIGLEMGLGKTPCGISIAVGCKDAGITPTLIIVPPSLRINWVREIKKFAPGLKGYVLKGTKPHDIPADADVLVMGDSSVMAWHESLIGQVGALVVDEAHRFKNRESKRSKALDTLSKSITGPRVLMSGTPMPNGRHAELAKQIDVLGTGAWSDIGGIGGFWQNYAPQTDSWGGRGNNDSEGLHKRMTNSWFFRRLRDDVIEMPNKGRTSLALEGKGKAVSKYRRMHEDIISFLADSNDGKVTAGQQRAEALIRLTSLRKAAGEAKVESAVAHIKELLDSEPGGVFVVAEHGDVMDGLLAGLSKYNATTVRGGMSDTAKAEAVDAFNSGASRVLVGQITAAGVGLTLHGDGRNHRVVIVQLPWTPADLKQAEDRLHRIGQTKDVHVEIALCAIDNIWTIDERLWNILEAKNFNTTSAIDGDGEFLLAAAQDSLLDTYR